MVNELTFAKGGKTVTVYTDTVAENFTNKIFIITPVQSAANQASGPKDNKIVDLLRIVHQFVIKGYIIGTADKTVKEVKEDLVSIYEGAGTTAGVITLTFDTDTYSGFIEKLNVVEKAEDSPATTIKDYARYEVAITFVEGVSI